MLRLDATLPSKHLDNTDSDELPVMKKWFLQTAMTCNKLMIDVVEVSEVGKCEKHDSGGSQDTAVHYLTSLFVTNTSLCPIQYPD